MTQHILRTDQDRENFKRYLDMRPMPVTVSVLKGAKRSNKQNKLQRRWGNELAEQGDMTAEEYRAHNKLHFGVPILRDEDAEFREKYDRIIKPLDYEQKLELMAEPFDFPVTRLMTTVQKKQFLDAVFVHWTGQGFHLTDMDGGLYQLYAREMA